MYRNVLSEDELLRAERFRFARHRTRWVTCRALLRQQLATYCGISAAQIVFQKNAAGKPAIASHCTEASAIPQFNLSHSRDLAVLAVRDDGPVGVDIEYLKEFNQRQAVAARFFTTREQAELSAVPASGQLLAFYCIWTRKEAILKATGLGLSGRLDAFDVAAAADDAHILGWREEQFNAAGWALRHLEYEHGVVGTLAVPRVAQP